MFEDYSIENLAKTFAEHAVIAEEHRQIALRMYKEQNPNCSIPEHLESDFSISKALHHICKEIQDLKK